MPHTFKDEASLEGKKITNEREEWFMHANDSIIFVLERGRYALIILFEDLLSVESASNTAKNLFALMENVYKKNYIVKRTAATVTVTSY